MQDISKLESINIKSFPIHLGINYGYSGEIPCPQTDNLNVTKTHICCQPGSQTVCGSQRRCCGG